MPARERLRSRCSGFHEKVFKVKMKFISFWCAAVGDRASMRTRSGGPCLDPIYRKVVERCHLVIEVVTLSGDASQSFRIVVSSMVERARVDKGFGFSTNSAIEHKVCALLPRPRASWPVPYHRPPASIHIHAARSWDQTVPECIAQH